MNHNDNFNSRKRNVFLCRHTASIYRMHAAFSLLSSKFPRGRRVLCWSDLQSSFASLLDYLPINHRPNKFANNAKISIALFLSDNGKVLMNGYIQ